MMIRLMPLPTPYSSICSPVHIRKTVPAVSTKICVSQKKPPYPGLASPWPPEDSVPITKRTMKNAWMRQITTVR